MKDDAFRKFLVLGIIILFVGASVVVPNVKILTNIENIFSVRATEILYGAQNNSPVFGSPTPANESTNQPLSFTWSIPINDTEGDVFNWSIECSNGQSNSSDDDSNGTKSIPLSGLLYSTLYTVWVNATDPEGSGNYTREWFTFTTKANNPPVFGLPNPTNNSADQPLALMWSIPINDPEGDSFDWSIECSNGDTNISTSDSNGTKSLSLSGLLHSTAYTVWVNATDPSGSGVYTRAWYKFITKASSTLVVTITKPAKGHFYFRDTFDFPLLINTIVYGPIEITVNATSDAGIEKVEFYINNRSKPASTDDEPPYSFEWKPIICGPYKIKVIAYDNAGQNASAEIKVLKWRAHPILILAGSLFILKQLRSKQPFRWTLLRGTVFNLKRVRNEYHARAVRLHYTEFTGLSRVSGTIKLKRISFEHSPFIRTYDIGPLGLTTYVFGFVPGGLN